MTTGCYAFVFWNDDLTEDGVRTQIEELAAAGFRGITLSARIGLSRRVGYLTEEFLDLVRIAVRECHRLGLAVMLYDEASYPSGSANGAVVARDPSFAARCLVSTTREFDGEVDEYWRPRFGRWVEARLVATVAVPVVDDVAQVWQSVLCEADDRGLVHLDLNEGRWRVRAIFDVPSGGTIRGAFADQEDGSATAPPAADLLNPDAVAAFIELTHEAYAGAVGEYFGTTVVAMFTDEPSLLGRDPHPGAVPYTPGFEDDVAEALGFEGGEVLRRLPALWDDADGDFSRSYHACLGRRLGEVYYRAQSRWCAEHGLALTGHPDHPDDLQAERWFDWPGQDTVWRWVLPGQQSALEGRESAAAKVAASAARMTAAPHAMAEVLGAYGWRLTLDEAKWLLDWYLVRGVSTLVLHALFYSVRGSRAFESEPDLGRFNSWWPQFPALLRYVNRVAAYIGGNTPVAPVAVLTDSQAAATGPVRALLTAQLDFFYITPAALAGGDVRDGRLHVGDQRYAVVVDACSDVPAGARAQLERFAAAGGLITALPVDTAVITEHLRRAGELVEAAPATLSLRVARVQSESGPAYLLTNEGEESIRTELTLPQVPADPAWYDPLENRWRAVHHGADGGLALELARRQSLVLASAPGEAAPVAGTPAPEGRAITVQTWQGTFVSGLGPAPSQIEVEAGDWTRVGALRTFAGACRYRADVDLPEVAGDIRLDLGQVGDAATLTVNGRHVAHLLWAPYATTVPAADLMAGRNTLEVLVTNNAANHYEGAERPSGLIGPTTLRY